MPLICLLALKKKEILRLSNEGRLSQEFVEEQAQTMLMTNFYLSECPHLTNWFRHMIGIFAFRKAFKRKV